MLHQSLPCAGRSQAQPVEPDPCARLAARRSDYLTFLRKRLRDPGAAEDVLQDFSLKVVRSSRHHAQVQNTDAWLARVLRNALFDHYRRRDARRRAESAYASQMAALADPHETDAGQALSGASGHGEAEIEAALARLRPDHAALIRAIYFRGVPRAAAAKSLGVAPGTLNVRLFRARLALREGIERLEAGQADGGIRAEHLSTCCPFPQPISRRDAEGRQNGATP
ncbi:MAG: RNA polymerase sigma factor [Proteobacteria bacterium]|nr:RNA polymerase sigma factor [Pseudomonadota bacterium]